MSAAALAVGKAMACILLLLCNQQDQDNFVESFIYYSTHGVPFESIPMQEAKSRILLKDRWLLPVSNERSLHSILSSIFNAWPRCTTVENQTCSSNDNIRMSSMSFPLADRPTLTATVIIPDIDSSAARAGTRVFYGTVSIQMSSRIS